MSDLEFLTGICQSVLNPIPEEDDYIDPYAWPPEEEEEVEPGWKKERVGWEPWGEPRYKYVHDGIKGGI